MKDLSKIENNYLAPGATVDVVILFSIKCFLIFSVLLYLSSATEQRQQSRF